MIIVPRCLSARSGLGDELVTKGLIDVLEPDSGPGFKADISQGLSRWLAACPGSGRERAS